MTMHAWILTLPACAGTDENISVQNKEAIINVIQDLFVIGFSRAISLGRIRLLAFPKRRSNLCSLLV
jgi:hypothetical protein